MWLLTCEGPLFNGKPLWLRPGSTHLLGRTTGRSEAGERIQYIDHKSVSRKHLTFEVALPKPGDSSRLYARSQVTVKDGSKIGTTLNNDKFSQGTRTLTEKEYTIKLGSYEHLFHLKWATVVLSATSSSKKSKSDAYRQILESADVKLVSEYVTNETTHAIAKKRNTPAGLQALCQAKWLVTDEFVEALARALEKVDGSSLLEDDFDGNWPNEENFVVPTGTEPEPKPNEYLRPTADRTEVFQEWVFVFLGQSQYDTLLPVITAGSGKALLWEVNPGESKVEDLLEYVKEFAGRKGSDQFRLSQQTGRGGIVLVRQNDRDEWLRDFMRKTDMALDQRSIEQNEFLGAILTVDASGLRQPLKQAPDGSVSNGYGAVDPPPSQRQVREQPERAVNVPDTPTPAPRGPPHTQPQPTTEEPPQEQPSGAAKRRNRRFITQSRFKDFDDFDPSQFSKPASQSPAPSFDDPEASQAPSVQGVDVDEPSQAAHTQQSSRKRPAPVQEDDENEEDMYANMLTAHTAMKRQKTAAGHSGKNALTQTSTEMERMATSKAAKAKKKEKEMDVMAEVQARRKREEEARQKDEEALREALEGVEISELKNLAKVEEMDIPDREPRARRANEDGRSDTWDPTWNGRKNFKKFRPQGQQRDGPRLQRVIVTLEEVPRKGHGIGEEYWLNSTSTSRSKSKSQSQSQTARPGAARSQRTDGQDEDSAGFRRRIQRSREQDQEEAAAQEIIPEEIAGHARDTQLEAAANSTPSQTFGTESQRKAAGKRPATSQAGGPAKKARQSRLAETTTLDDDDDDALKFRRRRR